MIFFSETMNLNIKNAIAFLTFKRLEEFKFIRHAFSTRIGGTSSGNFATLNLIEKPEDPKKNVEENLKRICEATELSKESIFPLHQNHSTKIKVIGTENSKKTNGTYDGSTTNIPGLTLTTYHADCAPLFLIDPKVKCIGLAHAGWRGTVNNIAAKIVSTMSNNYGSSPKDMICCIGPSIKSCCFEVKNDVSPYFEKIDKKLIINKKDKIYADIAQCNKINLLRSGLVNENIIVSDICTKCNCDLLYSYRAQGKKHGNMMAMIQIIQP